MIRRRPGDGTYVWVVGPDGCGKSSLATAMSAHLGAMHRYLRPELLPLARELAGRPVEGEINSTPHSVPVNNRRREMARLAYYLADYVIGYWFVFRPALRSGRDVIVERGWSDMSVDWRRYRLRGPRLPRVLGRLVHEPDMILVVTVPAAVAHARKRELPVDEIDRQYRAWDAFPIRRARRISLDNAGTIDNSVAVAIALVRPEVT